MYADDCAGGKTEPEDLLLLVNRFLQRCISYRFSPTRRCARSSAMSSSGSGGKVLLDLNYIEGGERCMSERSCAGVRAFMTDGF
jgi:hypothetical protein